MGTRTRDGLLVFAAVFVFFMLLRPDAPLSKALGVCECGAVRDILAGHVILPHYRALGPSTMIQTPPLFWWTAAISSSFLGWNEIALRLPSLIAGAATCAIIFVWLTATVSRRAAAWSLAPLALSHYFVDAARQPRMDAMLALLVTAATVCLERGFAHIPDRRRRILLFTAAAVLMGAGTLAKGPLGIVLPLIAVGSYLLLRRRWRELLRLPLIASVIGACVIGGAWYVAATVVGGEAFVRWQITQGLLDRFLGAGGPPPCPNPFYYFVPLIIAGLIPWSAYLPAAGALISDRRKAPEAMVFSACWFTATLLFFSSSRGKCFVYMLPGFPPLAAAIGITIDGLGLNSRQRGWQLFEAGTAVVAAVVAAMLLAAGALSILGPPTLLLHHLHHSDRNYLHIFLQQLRSLAPTSILWLVASAGGIAVALDGLFRRRIMPQAWGVLLISIAGTVFWFRGLNPAMARQTSLKAFSHIVDSIVPPGEVVYLAAKNDNCDLRFYSHREVLNRPDFTCERARRAVYVVVTERHLARMGAEEKRCLKPLAQSDPLERSGGRRLLFKVDNAGGG